MTDGCEWGSGINCDTYLSKRLFRWGLGGGVFGALVGLQMQKGGTTVYHFGERSTVAAGPEGLSLRMGLGR